MRAQSVRTRATIEFSATMTLGEEEMRALDALVGYGDDAFIKAFEEKLGAAYMRDHRDGLKSFFQTIREQVLPPLSDIDTARRDMANAIRKRELARQEALREQSAAK